MKMKSFLKKSSVILLSVFLLMGCCLPIYAEKTQESTTSTAVRPALACKSAVLMEAESGKVLYEQNADEALPPASVTKVMTLLLVMEAIESGKISYDDMVSASAHACSMGGSQIYLKEGETMSVEDLIKSVVISSANDAAVALAEHVCGTEEAFVEQMNRRAEELGMKSTHFENTNGLDDTAVYHVTSARDIALMSQALLKYEKITEFSSIWMDTIRNGSFGLTNTNRLIRFYQGATGLKTGSTSKAGFCISATAERENMTLICVIMGAETRDSRNAAATSLLDWGFANYGRYEESNRFHASVKVTHGSASECKVSGQPFTVVSEKASLDKIESTAELPEYVEAPIIQGQKVGRIVYSLNGQVIGSCDILADESISSVRFFEIVWRMIRSMSFY